MEQLAHSQVVQLGTREAGSAVHAPGPSQTCSRTEREAALPVAPPFCTIKTSDVRIGRA